MSTATLARPDTEAAVRTAIVLYETARRAFAEFRPGHDASFVALAMPCRGHVPEALPPDDFARLLRLKAEYLDATYELELALAEHCEPVEHGIWQYSLDPDRAELRVVRIDEGRQSCP
jgi:hypothetical protein